VQKRSGMIVKGSGKFLRGFSEPTSLLQWLEENKPIGTAFVGRSNVGKSSVINSLIGGTIARVSNTPGRTREINLFQFNITGTDEPVHLFDLPGYGHAEVSKEMAQSWNRMMAHFFENLPESILVLNIQDARHPNQSADLFFQKFVKQYDLEAFLLLNKIDKLKTQKERAFLKKELEQAASSLKMMRAIFEISAETKQGFEDLEFAIGDFLLNALELS